MRREFRPGFIVINPKYDQGSSGGGTSPDWADHGEQYCAVDGWIYMYCTDDLDGDVTGFDGPAWYRYKGGLEFDPDGWHAPNPPSDTPRCH